jgi:hypothetical protein
MEKKLLDLKVPKGWRKGQTLFSFLWWLKNEKLFTTEFIEMDKDWKPVYAQGGMADPFHIPDAKLEKLFAEFLLLHDDTQPPR